MKNKVLTVCLSAVIAFALWMYVITVVSPNSEETYYNIPVILQNENVLTERGLMITSEIPTVNLKLSGNRTDLIELNSSNINLIANVSSIMAPGTHRLSYTPSYPGNIPGNAITVQSSSINMVTLKVERRIKKNVDVVINYLGSVPEGFIADKENAIMDFEAIEVSGPESVMNQIDKAVIEVDLENMAQTIIGEFAYTLCDKNLEPVDVQLVTTNVESVNLTVKIQRVKEIELTVNVIDGGGATYETSSITVEPGTIRVSGSDTLLEQLEELELGTINLAELTTGKTLTFPVVLPEGVTNETGITEATVEVKFPNLVTKSFDVAEINAVNVPEGMEVDMITQVLEVKVRGPKELMRSMKESDLVVTVDFADAQLGTATFKAEITISDKFAEAGAVGTYSVSATLQEAEEEP